MGVKLHIEELVLQGFAPRDRHRIAGAMQLELARLMNENGVTASRENDISLDRLQGGTFRVKAGAKPEATGSEIARAVFRNLPQQTRPPVTISARVPAPPSKGGRKG
jgi:hypothetical protein